MIFRSVFNYAESLVSVVGNGLVLHAIRRSRSIHPPSKALLSCLAVTDLFTGITAQQSFAVILPLRAQGIEVPETLMKVASLPANAGSFISLCAVTTIAVDQLLAFYLAQRYREVVPLRLVVTLLVIFTILGFVSEVLWVFYTRYSLLYRFILIGASIFISSFAFVKVYVKLRRLQSQIRPQGGNDTNTQMERYQKSVKSMFAVHLLFIATYAPHWGVVGTLILEGDAQPALWTAIIISSTIPYLNSTLNPLLYFWGMREIRHNVMRSLYSIRLLLCGCE